LLFEFARANLRKLRCASLNLHGRKLRYPSSLRA
jgi:hypothetical protein